MKQEVWIGEKKNGREEESKHALGPSVPIIKKNIR
jgi:hypothetical protein